MSTALKQIESLWTLFTAPVIWVAHFLFCYVAAAIHCAKPDLLDAGFGTLRLGIAAATGVAIAAIVFAGYLAWRQWGFGWHDPPHDEPTRHDRTLFQGFATLLLSGLSLVAVIMTALPALFIESCLR